MFKAILLYFKLLIYPVGLSADHTIVSATSLSESDVIASAILLVVIIAIALYYRSRDNIIFFSIGWFFISLIPISNVFFPLRRFVGERFLYLPSIGFCLLLGYLLSHLYKLLPVKHRKAVFKNAIVVVPYVLIAILAVLTFNRNKVWQNEMALWTDTLQKSPSSFIAHFNMGLDHDKKGNAQEAVTEYLTAVSINPSFADAELHFRIGHLSHRIGKLVDAEKSYLQATRLKPDHVGALSNLAVIYAGRGDMERAIPLMEKCIYYNPNDRNLYSNLLRAYEMAGKTSEALELKRKLMMMQGP
jgi:tetratricopeptide (TPR) repeat protein